jgi:hypothetical protein
MKRAVFLLSILLLFSYNLIAQSLSTETFSEENENLPLIGNNFNIPIHVNGFGELLTLTIFFDYDHTVISYTGFVDPLVTCVEVTQPTENRIKVLVGNFPSSTTIPDGTLVNLQFDYFGGDSDLIFSDNCFYLNTSFQSIQIEELNNGSINGIAVNNILDDNGEWENTDHWSLQVIPNKFHNVSLLGTASIDSDAVCNNLTIGVGKQLTVNAVAALNVHGDILIDSDITGTGSFVNHGTFFQSGYAIVKQYLTGGTYPPGNWHLVGIPVNNALAENVFLNCVVDIWNEPSSNWQAVTEGNLLPMVGYSVAFHGTDDKMLEFEGILNDGPYSVSVTNDGTPNPELLFTSGWNLISNPYPSSLDADLLDLTNVDEGVSFWDQTLNGGVGDYASYASGVGVNGGTKEIPPNQGFFVQASGDGSVGVTNAARVHSGQGFYKSDPANTLRLTVEANEFSNEIAVRFVGGAGINYDGQFDFLKLFTNDVPQLYSLTSRNEKLAINALPEIDEDTPVNVGLKPGVNASMSLNASGIETFDSSLPIWLHDQVADIYWNLRENPVYNFVANTDDDENRFSIHFKNFTGVPGLDQPQVNIYAFNRQLFVDAGAGNPGEIVVVNILGQELVRSLMTENLNVVSLPVSNSYVVVKVISDQGITTRKVYVN